ncbi:MAG: ribosomal-protein-alanine N-acetyltransferase [Ruminococcaceae bacterium]|nr:ribosomal-protein-alanine N-acetyltransferase [Oscillospiraceae bacterium]
MIIRPAETTDIPALCRLEEECFSEPWSARGFAEFFENDCARCFAADEDGEVCGYVGFHLILGDAEITNLAVTAAKRRMGIAGALMEAVFATDGVSRVLLDVRESNRPARAFYEKYGFKIDGIRRGFYAKPREDAVLMSRDIKDN